MQHAARAESAEQCGPPLPRNVSKVDGWIEQCQNVNEIVSVWSWERVCECVHAVSKAERHIVWR